jgi:HEAT repeat protein
VSANTQQDEMKAKVAQAIALYPKDVKAAYEKLRALGVEAIPFIVEVIKDDESVPEPLRIFKKTRTNNFLINVITNTPGEQADAVLIEMLSSKNVLVRGDAALSLGEQKTAAAIPFLLDLLNDSETYAVNIILTHQQSPDAPSSYKVNVLIRDVAVTALQQITGQVLARQANKKA